MGVINKTPCAAAEPLLGHRALDSSMARLDEQGDTSPVEALDEILRSFDINFRTCCFCGRICVVNPWDVDAAKCCGVPVGVAVGTPSIRHCVLCKRDFTRVNRFGGLGCDECSQESWRRSWGSRSQMSTDPPGGLAVRVAQFYKCELCTSRYTSHIELQNHKEIHQARGLLGQNPNADSGFKPASPLSTPHARFPLSVHSKGNSCLEVPLPRPPGPSLDKPKIRLALPPFAVEESLNSLYQVGSDSDGDGGDNLADFLHIGADEGSAIEVEAATTRVMPSDPAVLPLDPRMALKAVGGVAALGAMPHPAVVKEGSGVMNIPKAGSHKPLEASSSNQAVGGPSSHGSAPSQVPDFSPYSSLARSVADAAVSKYGFAPLENINFETARLPSQPSRSTLSTYFSAQSHLSWLAQSEDSSRFGLLSPLASQASMMGRNIVGASSPPKSEFRKLIEAKGLRRGVESELNWSGRPAGSAQHVEFNRGDKIPLERVCDIGQSLTAKVEKVRCKRIMLARKTTTCTRRWKLSDAINEVEHLERIRNFHIVQLVGTYIAGREFSILLYPVADWNLKAFMNEMEQDLERSHITQPGNTWMGLERRLRFLHSSVKCLVAALDVIHAKTTKHMDIKPLNILVKGVKDGDPHHYRVYIADFGISRNFSNQDQSQTAGPTARSPIYCAPEVFNNDPRGRAADIFSMGCVFLEMATVLRGLRCEDFAEYREAGNGDGDESFHMNLGRVVSWSNETLPTHPAPDDSVLRRAYDADLSERLPVFLSMVSKNPDTRPTAAALKKTFGTWSCCQRGPEPFEAEE